MLNMDFSKQININTQDMQWQDSPAKGVQRKPLARENKESGHATSIVRYQAGAAFQRHEHPFGEEILVLSGVFSDETGDYPEGTYFRNPPGSGHSPFSKEGCTLFVKLCQFQAGDSQAVKIDTKNTLWRQGQGNLRVMPLHNYLHENTALVKWPANEIFQAHRHYGGEEILVLSGEFCDEHGKYPRGSWLRSPHMSQHHPYVDEETIILVKTGHLYQT